MLKLTVILSLLIGVQGYALNITPKALYKSTFEACSQVSEADLTSSAFDKLNAGYFPSESYSQIITYLRSQSYKESLVKVNLGEATLSTQYFLKSTSFHQALRDCYPKSHKMRNFFINSISKSDRAGKILGSATWILILRGVNGAYAKLSTKWSAGLSRLLDWLQVGSLALLMEQSTAKTIQKENQITLEQLEEANEALLNNNQDELKNSILTEIKEIEKLQLLCENCAEKEKLQTRKSIYEKALLAF